MRKAIIFSMVLGLAAVEARAWDGRNPAPEEVAAYRHIETLRQLAGEKTVIGDIQAQERGMRDAGETQRVQDQWVRATASHEAIKPYLEKPSCKTMKDYLFKTFALVDCFTLDGEGRVVGALYKSRNFLQDQEAHFVHCFNRGEGKIYVGKDGPVAMGERRTVEISLPVLDGSKTIGVLVATVLLEK